MKDIFEDPDFLALLEVIDRDLDLKPNFVVLAIHNDKYVHAVVYEDTPSRGWEATFEALREELVEDEEFAYPPEIAESLEFIVVDRRNKS